ncbi:hypothetical protein [Flavonifractor sp. An112]|uniref:hypothetical protein n=1 Tax=Flavonifractor sp. An112 TaxID=1965544 RepID=UPI001749ED4A|nr:hypothetical protein [Flavonifractor sp. An112]HIZ94544.1 hypothetical protein [Candidatus Flavonifractor avicola]
MTLPKTRLSTAMSGSAKETEGRIRNLFIKHRRPALGLVTVVALAIGLCGSLVACRSETAISAAPAGEELAFVLTEPGEETVPFADLLGLSGTVTHTLTDDGVHNYAYQIRLEDGTEFPLTETWMPLYQVDLDGDGAVDALVENEFFLQVYRYWPDGSLRTQQLQAAAAGLLGLEGDYWRMVELAFQPEDQMVVIHVWPYDNVGEMEERVPLSRLLEAANWSEVVLTPEGQPLPDGSSLSYLENLTLDGQGAGDDRLVARTTWPDGEDQGSTEMEVTLGTGEVLSWRYPAVTSPTVTPLHMTSRERQSLLASLASPGSNYGACAYVVLEVEDNKLAQRFQLDAVANAYVETGENGLQVLRIPQLYDQWHSPIWGTAAWDGSQITYTSDGYFTDTYELDVGGDETLTLALRCTPSLEEGAPVTTMLYDQVQLLKDGQVVQTITPEDVADDGVHTFQGFHIDSPAGGPVETRDINFDGVEEFGLLCDATQNACRCWFVWNSEAGQFRHLATLAGELTLLPEEGQLEERMWNRDWNAMVTRTYGWDSQGNLVLQSET